MTMTTASTMPSSDDVSYRGTVDASATVAASTSVGIASAAAARCAWLLRLAVFSHCAAIFAKVWATEQTHFGNLLFLEWALPYEQAVLIEKITASLYFVAGVITLIRPVWPVLSFIAAYAFIEAWAGYIMGGSRFSSWSLATHALRYAAPLALLMLTVAPAAARINAVRHLGTAIILRIGVATVFAWHGLQAFYSDPHFIDLILGSANNLIAVELTETFASRMLVVIGIVDLIVAFIILCRPVRPILLWAAAWGALTAVSRITTLGLGAYTEIFLRTAHALAPLALLYLTTRRPRPTAT